MSATKLATTVTAVVASTALGLPAAAGAQLTVRVEGLDSGSRPAFRSTTAAGTLSPAASGQSVRVEFLRDGVVLAERRAPVDSGTFRVRSPELVEPGRYRIRVSEPTGAQAQSREFRLRLPNLKRRDHGRAVQALNRRLRKLGYRAAKGARFTAATANAVLAYRKVNRMAWERRASSEVLSKVLRDRGAFRLRFPRAGQHVEVDLQRQVMALADRGKARHTFHISSGKPSTPSDRGHFRIQRRTPGYNSLGMLHSVYYNRGEALHGYRSVPAYPASNGCIRSPIPDARFIFDWVRLGMSVYVY
jgi:lipoprotein-anchoring transpeptidase ErfK/SrfK